MWFAISEIWAHRLEPGGQLGVLFNNVICIQLHNNGRPADDVWGYAGILPIADQLLVCT